MSSSSSFSSASYDEDVPDDEQSHDHLKSSSSLSSTNSRHSSNRNSTIMSSDVNDIDLVGKKKKSRDRPWQKPVEYDSIRTNEDELNVIGVVNANVISPASVKGKDDDSNDDDDDDDSADDLPYPAAAGADTYSFRKHNLTANINDDVEDIELPYPDDGMSSRWTKQQSSTDEEKAATIKAVGLAASKLAQKKDDDYDNEDLPYPDVETAAPSQKTDYAKVRMEALNLLNMADGKKDSNRGARSIGNSQTSSFSNPQNRKNRVQAALKGLGMDNHNRKEYARVSLEKFEDHHPQPDTSMELVTAEEMEYGIAPDSPEKNNNAWSSRYSIDRHMMALHGGLSSKQVLNKMDRDHYNDLNKNVSATNMNKTSPHEHDDRWNVASGMRSPPSPRNRLWYTLIATMKESVVTVKDSMSNAVDRIKKSNPDSHTTLGSHRYADHTSSPKGIFTGMAVTTFLDKLSPRSRSYAFRNFNQDVDFTAEDDYVYDHKLKRKKIMTMMTAFLVIFAVTLGITLAVSKRNRDGSVGATYVDVGETLKFYVTSDVPFNKADETKLSRDLMDLHPRDGDFLIHLGDISDATIDRCTVGVYEDAAELLRQSPIPVIVLPGNNDWNDCPDPMTALSYWMDELNRFEENFNRSENTNFPVVSRQFARSENFAFLHKGVLFIGFHLVDGRVQNEGEWLLRIAEDVAWMDEQLNEYEFDEYRSIVLLAHAAPTPMVGDFLWPLKNSLLRINKPTIYLHANDGDGMLQHIPFPDELPKFIVVRMEKGYIAPPTQITVDFGPHPFEIDSN